MYKQVAIVFIVAGIAILVYAITGADSFGDDLKEFFHSIAVYKSVWISAAGVVLSVIGVIGLLRDRAESKRKRRDE